MGVLTHNYLDDRSLRGLKAYKYKAGGYTWLDDLHNPMWNWVVSNLFPLWLAPNLVTLTGTLCLLASHLLLIMYAPHLDGENAPWWAHFLGFAAIVVYINLDCMDGKQARRTGTSNPLGQLFDHGCDAFCVGIILINVATSVGLTCGVKLTLMMFASMVTWVLAQWEEYHTGLMHYGNGYFGVLEANYALALVQLISAICGVRFWHQPVFSLLRMSGPITCPPSSACADPSSVAGMLVSATNSAAALAVLDALFYIALVFMLVQVSGQTWRVFVSISDQHVMDTEERGHKDLGTLPALKHLLIFVIFFGLSFMFLTAPDRGILQCRASLTYVSLAYAIIATQLIISHMAKEPWSPILGPFLGLVIAIFNSRIVVVDPALLVYALIATLTLFYLHYVINVVDQVCAYLGIRCLVIKKSQE